MQLISVYSYPDAAAILFNLLLERTPEQSISHQQMPTWEQHRAFVDSHPYLGWFIIDVENVAVGSAYLTHHRELGIFVFKAYHRQGYARRGITELMRRYPGSFLANINSRNTASRELWESLGFTKLQETYAYSGR